MHATRSTLSHPGVHEREVPSADWSGFFDGVMTEVGGLPVSVEIRRGGRISRIAARGVLHALPYDERGDVVEIAVRAPTPGRIAVMRHLIGNPVRVASEGATGLLPGTVVVQDADGDVTRLRLEPSPAFSG